MSHCSTFSPSHRRIFTICPHMTLHKGTSTEELQLYTWSTLLLSQTQSPLHKRNRYKFNHNHFYTRGIGIKPKLNHNHLYTRGIRLKAKAQPRSPLHKRDKHKPKVKKRLKLGDHNRPQTTLCDHNRPQIIFLTRTRSYR